MRWFKHMCNSNRDEKLSALMDEFGLEGYGFYWLVIELIGEQLNEKNKTNLAYSPNKWKRISGVSSQKLRVLLEFLKKHELFLVENTKVLITIDCPNLLKFRDEYTERASKNRDKLGTNSGQTPEQDTELDTELDTETKKDLKNTMSSKPDDDLILDSASQEKTTMISQARELLDFMNEKLNRNFQATTPNGKPTANAEIIIKRLKDGYTIQQMRSVMARKKREWQDQDSMSKYLRPETLFGKTKFASYLGECGVIEKEPEPEAEFENIFDDFPEDLFDENSGGGE